DADDEDKPDRVPATQITSDAQYREALRTEAESPAGAPGAILRARVEPDSWVTAGVPPRVNVMVTSPAMFSPIKADRGVNAVYFEPAETVLASGLMWNDLRRQIAYKPLVITENSGRGVVVGFAADPNFRG